ncbi:MAG: helix-turn-helix transcriptional regulator [Clostridia bacterium]|nr:helix-turn-helix transcriptional regulator [Clostridia bacterium]
MEFNEKLQELRKQKGLTQEELAAALYVSRAAVSKWESGRGYPGIDSLKAISAFFSVTVDEMLSSGELLTIAEEDGKKKSALFCDLIFGLLDLSLSLLFFLPFFAEKRGADLRTASILSLGGGYLKAVYLALVVLTALSGISILALQTCGGFLWNRIKTKLSLTLGTAAVLLFIISSQPYAAVFAFVLLVIKTLSLIKRR